jgi:hypothetical protein
VSANVYLTRSGFVVRVNRASFGDDPPTARDGQFSTPAIARTGAGADLTLKIDPIQRFEAAQLTNGFPTRFESLNGLSMEDVFEKGLHFRKMLTSPRLA